MSNTNPSENRETLGRLLRRLPEKGAYCLMLLLSAAGAYYATTLVMVLFGASYIGLSDPLLLFVWAIILIVVNLIGLWLKRVMLANAVFGFLLVAWMTFLALHGNGPVLTWIRPIVSYALMATLNGLCFRGIEKSYSQ